MSANHHIDTLIIGQGLAGSMLAWQLMAEGQQVMVIADEKLNAASRAAAGLFNPVTGKRLVLQPHAELIIPEARAFYRQLEAHFNQPLFHEKEMLRVISTKSETEAYEKRCKDPAYAPYLGETLPSPSMLNPAFELLEQKQTGYLDTNRLLDCLKTDLQSQRSFHACRFIYNELTVTTESIRYREIRARRIIFCEGYMGMFNPWFKWLPFQPAKGEILTLKTSKPISDRIINAGKWLLPLEHGNYKTGATYERDLSNTEPTQAGYREVVDSMQKMLSKPVEFELLHHQAGVRPNTRDKQPFIGLHPEQPRIGIFNGFGSKGSMLIPYYSQAFAHHLIDGSPIPAEADICRIAYE